MSGTVKLDVEPDGNQACGERSGLLPRGYLTPPCKVGADRWLDLHQQCRAPGYRHPSLGWVPVACACTCHTQTDGGEQS